MSVCLVWTLVIILSAIVSSFVEVLVVKVCLIISLFECLLRCFLVVELGDAKVPVPDYSTSYNECAALWNFIFLVTSAVFLYL